MIKNKSTIWNGSIIYDQELVNNIEWIKNIMIKNKSI